MISTAKQFFHSVVPVQDAWDILFYQSGQNQENTHSLNPIIPEAVNHSEEKEPASASSEPPPPMNSLGCENSFFVNPNPGDFMHKYLPGWKYGEHCVDLSLRNCGNMKISELYHYKSDILPKGCNTAVAIAKTVIAPVETCVTDTKWIEHHWIVAKAADTWIATWKDFEGNIQVREYASLEAANRDASYTMGNDAGKGIKCLHNFRGSGYTVGSLIAKIRSIQPSYHLTLCNCIGYAKEIYKTFKNNAWPQPAVEMIPQNELEKALSQQPKVLNKQYTTEESGPPYHRKVTVFKDGNKVAEFTRRHFRHARSDAATYIEDDKYHDSKQNEALQNLIKEIPPAKTSPKADMSKLPSSANGPVELKESMYTTSESGSPYARTVTVFKDGNKVAEFTKRHFRHARSEADKFIEKDKAAAKSAPPKKEDQTNTDDDTALKRMNAFKVGCASAATHSALNNFKLAKEGKYLEFGQKVAWDTGFGGSVSLAMEVIKSGIPNYTTMCSAIRATKKIRVNYSNDRNVVNPLAKLGANLLPLLASGAAASNPITFGIAVGIWSYGADKAINWAIPEEPEE